MRKRITIVYNDPQPSRYDQANEKKAVIGVLDSVSAVRTALLELRYGVKTLPLSPPLDKVKRELNRLDADAVFNLFEGFCGEPETEAMVPEILAKRKMPYTGCPAPALRLALDKARMKMMMKKAGIPTPDFQLLNPRTMHHFRLRYPCIVKPRSEDSSHAITAESVVNDLPSLEKRVKAMSAIYDNALVEEFIDGREFNATVMGTSRCTVLPVSEIVYQLPPSLPRILTFDAKWEPDSLYYQGTKVVCPAEIGESEQAQIAKTSMATFRLLGCSGFARVDMRMNGEGKLQVIEVNPNPDISPEAGAALQASAAGMDYNQFIKKIVEMAMEKEIHGHKDTSNGKRGQTSPHENTAAYARI